MKKEMIIRAWKDPEYRSRLSAEEREALPDNPSGKAMTELEEAELGIANGGRPPDTAPILCNFTERPVCTARRRACFDC